MSYECDNDNHAIGCQCPGVRAYPGAIVRKTLIEFCQRQAVEVLNDSETFYAASNSANLNHEQRLDFLKEYSSCLGEVRALRKVCEWAKEHKETSNVELWISALMLSDEEIIEFVEWWNEKHGSVA